MSNSEILKTIEAVFEDRQDYLNYFNQALQLFRNPRSRKASGIDSLIPEYIEIEFSPNAKSPQSKGDIRKNTLPFFASIKGRIEVAITDKFAIRFKLLNTTDRRSRSKKSKKNI